jgi:hypothetical protein
LKRRANNVKRPVSSFLVVHIFIGIRVHRQLLEVDGVKIVAGDKQSDPNVWLDRLAAIFRFVLRKQLMKHVLFNPHQF